MPQPAAPPPAQRRSAVKTAAEVYAATQVAGAGAAAARAPAAAGVAAGGASVAAAGIMAGFVTWLAQLREQHRRWLAGRLGPHGGRADDVAEVLRTEMLLEQEFARRSADRLAGALPQALRITDPRERERRIRQLLADEERYARQRAEAMVARAIAAVSRAALRRDSPLGAFWRLGHARNHTTGCEHPDAALRVRGLLAIGRRRYVGVLVKATTARGRVVAVTPNHPVLTSRGWLPAHALNEGDYLFDASGLQSGAGRYQDFDDGPTSAQEIFDALAARGDLGITELPVGSEDFHGDGQHGYVEVVGANGALLDGLISGRSQRVGERLLMPTDATLAQLASEGRSTSSGVAVDALFADGAQSYATALKPQRDGCAAHARVTGEGEHRLASLISPDQLRRSSGNALGVLLRDRHAEAFKSADDGMRTPESVVPRQAGASLASLIAPDEIVRIRRVPYSGHVYSLSTEPGWYMSEQRVVHNCLHMAGKFWPWVVLDRVAPPRHYGCTSSLHSYAEAVLKGWMGPEDVPDPRAAVRAASGVVMEAAEADALLAELDVRDQLREQGVDTSAIAFAGLSEAFTEAKHPRGYHGRFRKVGDVAEAITAHMLQWRDISGAPPDRDAPEREEIVKNWTKQVRGRLSSDPEAHRLVSAAMTENDQNALYRRIVGRHVEDHAIITKPVDRTKIRSLLDTADALHRLAGSTVLAEDSVRRIAEDYSGKSPGDPAAGRAATSAGYGLAAALRHEYGHSIDDNVITPEVRAQLKAALPDPGKDLSYYSGYLSQELVPELFALVTDPRYDPKVWPETVQKAGRVLLKALGEVPLSGPVQERTVAAEPRDPRGRWVRSAAALLKAGKPAEIEPRDAPALIDELASETQPSSLHLLQIKGHPNLFRAHARELSRGEMPQIPKAHLPGFMDYLAARRVTARVQSVHPSSLQATQNQIYGGAAALIAKVGNVKGLMMVSRDGHVLDGHHRWGAAALLGANDPNARVDVLRFSVGTDRILRLMREYNELAGVQARVFGEGRVAK